MKESEVNPTQIEQALRRGEWASALHDARQAVQDAPDDPRAHRLLAIALAVSGDPQAAHASLDRALALAPEDAETHYQRAALLLSEQRIDEVGSALARSVQFNPNELRAYVMQAQLALARRDADEAERLLRSAARIDADHPWLLTMQGTLALQRGQAAEALPLLSRAAQMAPDSQQTLHALGLGFLANGHSAFAEQAFRRLLERAPRALTVRHLLSLSLHRQERFAEAAAALLDAPEPLPAHLLRTAGEAYLQAGDHVQALPPLRQAATQQPGDARALSALIEAFARHGAPEQVREMVEAELLQMPEADALWAARVFFAASADDRRYAAERWQQALPQSQSARQSRMRIAAEQGDQATAMARAQEIVQDTPGDAEAHMHIVLHTAQTDPLAAIVHAQSLLANPNAQQFRADALSWLAYAQERAGHYADAVHSWLQRHPTAEQGAVPLPAQGTDRGPYPPASTPAEADGPMFLYGPPGSAVERIAALLARNATGLRADRLQPPGPADLLRSPEIVEVLPAQPETAAQLIESWRQGLPARGTDETRIIDWLLWWDNALLHALRPHLPGGQLLLVLRDPRQMLLDWLTSGTYIGFEMVSPEHAAAWLARQLEQLAELIDSALYPHVRIDIDAVDINDPQALSAALGQALGVTIQPAKGLGPGRHLPGHWRLYREALRDAFALLEPVAQRLGYPPTSTTTQ